MKRRKLAVKAVYHAAVSVALFGAAMSYAKLIAHGTTEYLFWAAFFLAAMAAAGRVGRI